MRVVFGGLMLNLNLLRVFHQVVEQHGVSGAAEKLFISQPAVSNALKRLQKDAEGELFVKQGRALELSEYGRTLHGLTTRLCSLEQEIEELFEEMRTRRHHVMHLGLVTIYERFGMEAILDAFSSFDEGLSVSVHSGNTRTMLRMLREHAIDVAITGSIHRDDHLLYTNYKRHSVYLVVPQGHRLYGRKTFTGSDIREERMALKERGSSVRRVVDAYLEKNEIRPVVVTELSNIDSILNLVANGHCISFLPDMSVDRDAHAAKSFGVIECADGPLEFRTYVVTRKIKSYPEAMQPFIERIHREFA